MAQLYSALGPPTPRFFPCFLGQGSRVLYVFEADKRVVAVGMGLIGGWGANSNCVCT